MPKIGIHVLERCGQSRVHQLSSGTHVALLDAWLRFEFLGTAVPGSSTACLPAIINVCLPAALPEVSTDSCIKNTGYFEFEGAPVGVLLLEACHVLQHHFQRPVAYQLYVLPTNYLRPLMGPVNQMKQASLKLSTRKALHVTFTADVHTLFFIEN